jgi:hypothetical protein
MSHIFKVLIGENIHVFNRYEDIPMEFDNLIEFLPEIPPGPHTHEQHEEIDSWHDKFKELMKRERM